MTRLLKRVVFLPTLLMGLFLLGTGCGGSDSPTQEGIRHDSLSQSPTDSIQTFFQVSTPGEFFSNLRRLGLQAKPGLLNPVDNISSYTGSKEKSINFGVYCSDLFYCSNFDQKSDVLKIFRNLHKLAEGIGIPTVFSGDMLRRTEKNLGKNDSVKSITRDIYYNASFNLEKNKQVASHALMIAGGFVESIYISTSLSINEKEGGEVYQFLADQKYPLENLLRYLDQYTSDTRVSEVKIALEPLKKVFSSILEEPVKARRSRKGKVVIGGSSRLVLTKVQFKELKEISAKIRNEFTLNQA